MEVFCMLKTMFVLAVSIVLLLFSACSQKVNNSADVKAIEAAVQDYAKGYTAKDANAIASLMTDDAAFAQANSPAVVGKEAAQKLLQGIFAQYEQSDIELGCTTADIQVRGDLGVAHGTYTFKGTHKTGLVPPTQDTGNWIAEYKRQSDGSWKCISSIGNSNNPLPGTTADGADEKALIQIEQDLAADMTKGDTAAMDRFVAKEWVIRTAEGQLLTKAQFLGELKTAYKISSVTMKNLSPHVFGDFAIVSMIAELKGTYKGKDASGPQQSVDFCIRRDGRWQAVYSQNAAVKP
jgi:uncharacterized protein (TIGR02246 family)